MKKITLILSRKRFNTLSPGEPFFLTSTHKDSRLWFKTATGSAFCIADGAIKYIPKYSRIDAVIGGL